MVHSGSFIRLLPGDGTTEIAARLLPLLETIFDVSAKIQNGYGLRKCICCRNPEQTPDDSGKPL